MLISKQIGIDLQAKDDKITQIYLSLTLNNRFGTSLFDSLVKEQCKSVKTIRFWSEPTLKSLSHDRRHLCLPDPSSDTRLVRHG